MIDVCVIGGGPAGLAAAVHAAGAGARSVVFERNDRCGVKLLATGGGHCNVGNLRPAAEWPVLFGRRGRFIVPALERLPTPALRRWLEGLGVPTVARDGFHLYPVSDSAKQVRDALVAAAARAGVEMRPACRVEEVHIEDGGVVGLGVGGARVAVRTAVVASGGKSYPATGSTGDGYRLAESAGHRIRPPLPGLVGLRADNLDADLAGLVLPDAEVLFKPKGGALRRDRGELLLTHAGVSGPAVLDLSAAVSEVLSKGGGKAILGLRWCAGMDRQQWQAVLAEWRARRGGAAVAVLLREYLPQRLARWLCGIAGIGTATTAAALPARGREALVDMLSAYPAGITASEGWERAMITRGGVDVGGIDPATMSSRVADGLYFAGEVVDMDGPCGGYNLHWAFASGALAGISAAQRAAARRSLPSR